MAEQIELDPKKTPRAARLLDAMRAKARIGSAVLATGSVADAVPNEDAKSHAVRKLDRTVRFPKPENALRQHAAEASKTAPATPRIKIKLKTPPAEQASTLQRRELSERIARHSPQAKYALAAGRGALGAVAEPGAVAAIPTAAQLGRLVRLRRTDLGLSQVELAQRGAVGRRFVAELEAGKPSLELGRTLNVCGALDIQLFAVVEHAD